MPKARPDFPFTAVASQEQFKLALLLVAINPLVGGVLISGPRGSAKSTLARAMADILPQQAEAASFVSLPLGASEEMLTGTINLQKVLDDKKVQFQPGLLAKANNGVLYVDEVNLLPDNLVDQLLDVAASGVNVVERDGISHRHSTKFILLGTMNPDEGELRAQFLDRFGLSVNLTNQYTLAERIEIVRLREEYEKDSDSFAKQYEPHQKALAQNIEDARCLLPLVSFPDECRLLIAKTCCSAEVDGLRADIVWTHAARAHAAFMGEREVRVEDVIAVEELVLNHRRNTPANDDNQSRPFTRPPESLEAQQPDPNTSNGDWGAMNSESQPATKLDNIELFDDKQAAPTVRTVRGPENTAKLKAAGGARGLRKSGIASDRISWFKSLIKSVGDWPIKSFCYNKRKQGAVVLHIVLLDTSGSILSQNSFAKAKGVILQIAESAYLKRELFVLLGFGNQQVNTLIGVRRAPKALISLLDNLKAGGGTPVHEALMAAVTLQKRQLKKTPSILFQNYMITDGRTAQLNFDQELAGDSVVIDVEQSQVKRGRAKQIATAINAKYIQLLA